ncbi:TIR domain-containing protein [Desulfonatronum thiosulfatophilum]|uniref:TIR domain-containing protein n=1 Tax=Desulfonatronum thiosulfatophilum TaxID=617002 RepID=UPI000B859546|nr:TIR domain-containing protein [Desulfonatronum thiosulfatophilum]
MSKYHIALSFAGEDRDYVDRVATHLRENGVEVFYDKFEETKLWGKDLYTYLTDIYQNRALYTVMFVSEAYKEKLWTNHERQSAQARAFSESQEYCQTTG